MYTMFNCVTFYKNPKFSFQTVEEAFDQCDKTKELWTHTMEYDTTSDICIIITYEYQFKISSFRGYCLVYKIPLNNPI